MLARRHIKLMQMARNGIRAGSILLVDATKVSQVVLAFIYISCKLTAAIN